MQLWNCDGYCCCETACIVFDSVNDEMMIWFGEWWNECVNSVSLNVSFKIKSFVIILFKMIIVVILVDERFKINLEFNDANVEDDKIWFQVGCTGVYHFVLSFLESKQTIIINLFLVQRFPVSIWNVRHVTWSRNTCSTMQKSKHCFENWIQNQTFVLKTESKNSKSWF